MSSGKGEETALGTARGRFLDALPDKCAELSGLVQSLREQPEEGDAGEELRRRFHALYASALVFRSDSLTRLVQQAIACLDAARSGDRALTLADVDLLAKVVDDMAALGDGGQFSSKPPSVSLLPRRSTNAVGLRPSVAAMRASFGAPALTGSAVSLIPSSLPPADTKLATLVDAPQNPVTSPPVALLQRVLRVLTVAAPARFAQLKEVVGDEGLRFEAVESGEAALDAARQNAPDVILIHEGCAGDFDTVSALRSDPLTDFVPIVMWKGAASAEEDDHPAPDPRSAPDASVRDPLELRALMQVLGGVSGTLIEPAERGGQLTHATLEEVAERVAQEIRHGVVEAADCDRGLRIPFGSDLEVRAAAWAAVARVRALAAERSGGRVRFRDGLGGPVPLVLAPPPEQSGEALSEKNGSLRGRRVLIVDDDPAVVSFFSGLLRREGAETREAKDGRVALEAARRERPDLVISDVLMPHMDGFTLCRELKRDPSLADVPVILISWKEDLLVRMRELASGADGYLCKEADATQILSSIRGALRPRSELERALAQAEEVKGELEEIGIVALLRSVAQVRVDARVTVRGAWDLLECEVRDGRLVQVTRTAADGSFVRNERALPQLVGMVRGRYVVQPASGSPKAAIKGSLDETLAQGARALGTLLAALRPPSLDQVGRIVFDEDARALLTEHAPPTARDIIERLAKGTAPAQLCREGRIAASVLEPMLADLARRGAIQAVLGSDGQDLVAPPGLEAEPLAEPRAPRPEVSLPTVLDPGASVAGATQETGPAALPKPDGEVSSSASLPQEAAPSPAQQPRHDAPAELLADEAPAESLADAESSLPAEFDEADDDTKTRDVASEARRSQSTLLAWALALVCLIALGVFLGRASSPGEAAPRVEAIGSRPSLPGQPGSQGSIKQPTTSASLDALRVVHPAQGGGFAVYEGILERGVEVSREQGLLVVEAPAGLTQAELSVDSAPAVKLPAALALSEGSHELVIRHGDAVSYRFLTVTRGRTFVLPHL